MQYRVLRGRYAGQIVAIVKRNGSAVRVALVGVPADEWWTSKNNLEATDDRVGAVATQEGSGSASAGFHAQAG